MTTNLAAPVGTLSRRARRWVLTAHIIVSVGLLGDSAGFLAIAVRSAMTDDPQLADAGWQMLEMFGMVFGIPLTLASLITGLILGLGSNWGVFRYPWVTTKLLLVLSVMVVGGAVFPGLEQLREGGPGLETRLIVGAAYDVTALSFATWLSVFKPGRRRWPRTERLAERRDRVASG
jgi:hypothetical protein